MKIDFIRKSKDHVYGKWKLKYPSQLKSYLRDEKKLKCLDNKDQQVLSIYIFA